MGTCKTHIINTDAKYYFNDIKDTKNESGYMQENTDQNEEMEQRVSLICSIKNVDSSKEFKIELILYSDTQRINSKSVGFTEKRSKNAENIILFEQFFAIPYYFEKQQLLDFKITNGKILK